MEKSRPLSFRKGFFESIFADKEFEFKVVIDGVNVLVRRDDDFLDLVFDGKSFNTLLHETKTKKHEKKRVRTEGNIALAKSYFQTIEDQKEQGRIVIYKCILWERIYSKTHLSKGLKPLLTMKMMTNGMIEPRNIHEGANSENE